MMQLESMVTQLLDTVEDLEGRIENNSREIESIKKHRAVGFLYRELIFLLEHSIKKDTASIMVSKMVNFLEEALSSEQLEKFYAVMHLPFIVG